MKHTSTIVLPDGTTITEVYEDAALAAAVKAGPVTFRVLDDEWDADYLTRTIKRADILRLA